jgi:hypothetical protein
MQNSINEWRNKKSCILHNDGKIIYYDENSLEIINSILNNLDTVKDSIIFKNNVDKLIIYPSDDYGDNSRQIIIIYLKKYKKDYRIFLYRTVEENNIIYKLVSKNFKKNKTGSWKDIENILMNDALRVLP